MEVTKDPGQQLYPGLYGEVVTEDVYGLLDYAENHDPPDVIFDIGANVGIFTRFAREVFPDAFIVAVEPDDTNFALLDEFTPDSTGMVFIHAAIGGGAVWRSSGAANGAHETYISVNPGYTAAAMDSAPDLQRVDVDTVLLGSLVAAWKEPGAFLVKLDCEGNENAVFADEGSMAVLADADYFAAEIHTHAVTGGAPLDAVKKLLTDTYARLAKTHDCVHEHVMWRCVRRSSVGTGKSL